MRFKEGKCKAIKHGCITFVSTRGDAGYNGTDPEQSTGREVRTVKKEKSGNVFTASCAESVERGVCSSQRGLE